MSAPFTYSLRVRYIECDQQNIVFNSHYLTFFDIAHTEMLREAVGAWDEIVARGVEIVVGEANVRYRAPARFDDVLDIDVSITRLGRTSLTTQFVVRRGDVVCTEGELRHVAVELPSHRPIELPDWLREPLQRYVIESAEAA